MTSLPRHASLPHVMDDAAARCAICDERANTAVMVRLGASRLVRCDGCGSWTYLPRLTPESQARLHDTSEYFAHPYFQHRRQSTEALRHRCQEALTRVGRGFPLRSLRGERVLDIGCDTGGFAREAAQMFGFIPIGIDVSMNAVEEATRRGMEAYHASIEGAPGHLRDLAVITAIDLIEHVVSPREFLHAVYDRLRPGGVVYLETPNIASIVYRAGRVLCRLTGARPQGMFERLFPRQHAQYFTRNALWALAERCGFEVVQIDTRLLPFRAVGTSLLVRAGVVGLQLLDVVTHARRILICAVLRKPLRSRVL